MIFGVANNSVTIHKKLEHTNERLSSCTVRLYVTVKYLVAGDCFGALEALHRVPRSSISKFMPDVLEATYLTLEDFIKVRKEIRKPWPGYYIFSFILKLLFKSLKLYIEN